MHGLAAAAAAAPTVVDATAPAAAAGTRSIVNYRPNLYSRLPETARKSLSARSPHAQLRTYTYMHVLASERMVSAREEEDSSIYGYESSIPVAIVRCSAVLLNVTSGISLHGYICRYCSRYIYRIRQRHVRFTGCFGGKERPLIAMGVSPAWLLNNGEIRQH